MEDLAKEIFKIARLFISEQLEGYSNEKGDPDLSGGQTSQQVTEKARKRKAEERGSSPDKTRERDTKLKTRARDNDNSGKDESPI